MIIEQAKINCYKSIKQPMLLNLHKINIIIGQNNSGKSNILDAIQFALQAPGQASNIFYEKTDLELKVFFNPDEQNRWQLPEPSGIFVQKKSDRELKFTRQTLPYNNALSKILSPQVKRLDEEAFANYRQIETDYRSLQHFPGFYMRFQENLKKHFPKILASHNALDINYESDGLYEGERRVTIDRLGSGFRRIFIMLLYIFHPSYQIVLIDEPETHLHPALQERLLWAMQNSDAGQIIFTTHSPLFLTPMTLPQVVRTIKDEKSTKAFGISHVGGTHGYYDPQRLLQELNADNLQMFFADEVVMVEGMSDKLLLRGLIDHFYEGDKDIKVVQTHGKGNMKVYIDLLRMFEIPYRIIMDRDVFNHDDLFELLAHLKIHLPKMSQDELIQELKKSNVYIFPNGDLEANYPRKYQKDKSKSLNALRAVNRISPEDFLSNSMSNLREIVNSL
ncbi:MAG: AAA family ATPase [Patescibacteria group bacterium]|jgi:predicted ATP-dependent endonuclease of OLD family